MIKKTGHSNVSNVSILSSFYKTLNIAPKMLQLLESCPSEPLQKCQIYPS